MMKRYEIQVLLRAGHTQAEVARLTRVPERTIRRVQAELLAGVDDGAERERRGIGRPSKAEPFRSFVTELFDREPELRSVEVPVDDNYSYSCRSSGSPITRFRG
jgi:hypothetical protein